MLTFDAVTTYADRHWKEHAQRCVETFREHWGSTKLRTYNDQALEDASEWLPEFKQRHRHRPTYNYRFDAIRFAHKVAAVELAFRVGNGDVLIWIDADCITHSKVTEEWLNGLIGDADFAYLRRAKKYPELGFFMLRRNAKGAELISKVVRLYKTDRLFDLPEWHDCMAIDSVREEIGIRSVSISGDAEATGHPLVNGPLGACLDHLKGKRKVTGRSHRSDLIRPRTEEYWLG